jgi:hypothetical protein
MLARASVEALFLGLYCLRVPEAVAQLHADNIKALGDGLAYVEETGIVPAQVIRDCVARLGESSRRYLGVWEMVEAIDEANGTKAARSLYRRLYVPLSNFTVHARGGTLLRHVRRGGFLLLRRIREAIRLVKEIYAYLWTGPATAHSVDVRATYIRERFGDLLDFEDPDIPEGSLDPFIKYIAEELARVVQEPIRQDPQPWPEG